MLLDNNFPAVPSEDWQQPYLPAFITPTSLQGKVLLANLTGKVLELWPIILEKALAKVFGTYEMLEVESDDLASTLRYFTGNSLMLSKY